MPIFLNTRYIVLQLAPTASLLGLHPETLRRQFLLPRLDAETRYTTSPRIKGQMHIHLIWCGYWQLYSLVGVQR